MSMRLKKRPTESTTDLQDDNKGEVTEATPINLSFKEKIKLWIKLITVEPTLFLYLFASLLAGAAAQNLAFEMACRVNLELNDTLCSNYTLGIKESSVEILRAATWSSSTVNIMSAILVLCFSTFSDRYIIRKPFFVFPVLGEVFSVLGLFLCVIFINSWPIDVYFIFAIILPACFGGSQTIIMAINSYIADISSVEERTTRVGFVEIISLILTPIAPALGGILYKLIGYYGILAICGILFLLATLHAAFYIHEKREPSVRTKNTCLDIFNIKAVIVDMFKVLFSKRVGYRRILLILSYVCFIMIKGATNAENAFAVQYISVEFKWDTSELEYFHSFDILVHIIGMLLAITIFTRKLKISDLMLVVIACCFKIIASLWWAFGKSVIMYCIGPLISVFSGIFIIALRSFVTKLVKQTEIGKAQALFAICEAVIPLIYRNIYLEFYKSTKKQFHGAFFLLTVALTIPPLILALIMHNLYKNDPKEETAITNGDAVENQKREEYNEGNDIEISKL